MKLKEKRKLESKVNKNRENLQPTEDLAHQMRSSTTKESIPQNSKKDQILAITIQ